MRAFSELSGPWTGLSIQGFQRLTESIRLVIANGNVSGEGTDIDGRFSLTGFYDDLTQEVALVRLYQWTVEPTQSSVGIAFDYRGVWDGAMVSGEWLERGDLANGGPFEMWPDREEDRNALRIDLKQMEPLRQP